jgi:flap endonuclease-1
MEKVEWKFDVTPQSIMDFFMKPPTTENYTLEWKDPDIDRLKKFLVDEHDFSADRIDKFSARLKESAAKGRQSSLGSWFK